MSVREAIRQSLALFSARDRRLLIAAIVIQMATSLLDLVGVLLLGLVGALAVTTVQSQPPPAVVTQLADVLGLSEVSDQALVGILAGAAAVVLLMKSIVSSYLNRRVFGFLAHRQALVTARLAAALLSRPLTFIKQRSSQETAFALINGSGAATLTILGQLVVAATEVALLVVLGGAVLLISPLVAIASIAFFGLVAVVLHRTMGGWASRVGEESARADIASLNAVQEAISAYREVTVADRRPFYVERIQDLRWRAASVAADAQFIGMFPKYVFEAALVIGGFALAAVLFSTQDSVAAVGTLALFLAAGTRVMPSLMRLQGATLTLRGAAGVAGPTFALAQDLGHPVDAPAARCEIGEIRDRLRRGHPDFTPAIDLQDITVHYPGASTPAIKRASLTLGAGQSLALVGRSGAGKSTLADVILGVLDPDEGLALLGGVPPGVAVTRWPGGVAYVPQEVMLANDTVRSNVALGLPREAIDDDLVWEALERAFLADHIRASNSGLESVVGERGSWLSGGQRQRLGIARALYTRPRLIVLDEATSALDAETEQAIARMIDELEGTVTTVIIAHRLSTIRHVDVVVYLEDGSIQARGSFDEVRKVVPALERQASLMGLS